MIKIPTASQMRELDADTVKKEAISPLDLMERAATAVAQAIMSEWDSHTPILVFAGSGNNGGDALAVARILYEQGYNVEAYLFNIGGKLSPECQANRKRISECSGLSFTEVTTQFEPPRIEAGMLVVDGLFGTGLSRPLEGGFAQLVALINMSPANVVSVDMPSGLMCEDNSSNNRSHIVRATLTLTFQLPKLSLLLADNQMFVGRLRVLDIGLSPEAIAALPATCTLLEPADFVSMLQPRMPFSHKGTFGHALLVAGKYGMAGAAVLAARACLRSGVGKLTVHTPQMNNDIVQMAVPEAVISHDESDETFTTPVDVLDSYSALGIGCGIGTASETATAFMEQIRRTHIPLLIDADGLNILATHKKWITLLPPQTVLTPHLAEFRRLAGHTMDDGETLAMAKKMAVEHKIFIVLKGHYTAVCSPDGIISFNTTGNAGMATAGSGDVLTGVITALLAQGYLPEIACRLGVFLHGLAGDLAAEKLGEDSMVASDIIAYLPAAFRSLRVKGNS